MWGPPGIAYVYLCYGIHNMLNFVTNPKDEGAAVLIRACEPIEGLETIQTRRHNRPLKPDLLSGPGKVGEALGLDPSWSNHPLHIRGGLEVLRGAPVTQILTGPRVGINYASPEHIEAPWRLAMTQTPWVSHLKALKPAS